MEAFFFTTHSIADCFQLKPTVNMIKIILHLLKASESRSRDVLMAKGRYKLPENWKEFKRHLKLRVNG